METRIRMVELKNEITTKSLKRLTDFIRLNYGYEFGEYSQESIKRRVERYTEIKGMSNAEDLILALKSRRIFDEFIGELTVNTTDMFRDPEVWKYLSEDILPKISNSKDVINIWHSGCSTGEEVLSMAIVLTELGVLEKAKILATDINPHVLNQAQSGLCMEWRLAQYEKNFNEVFPESNFSDYYDVVNSKVQFDYNLIKNVVYKQFDLVLDTSFSKYDLIFCRNVLIYFNDNLKKRVYVNLNNALSAGGFIVLGKEEGEEEESNYNVLKKQS